MRVSAVPLHFDQDLGHSGWRWKSTSFGVIPTLLATKLATSPLRQPEGQDQCQTKLICKSLSNGYDVLEESQSTGSNHRDNMVIKAYKLYYTSCHTSHTSL